MHRRLLSAAATSALLLGLAACGEPTDGPVTTPPPSISVSGPSDGGGDTEPSDRGGETAEPTAEAPNIPPPDPADFAGMEEHTAEGAEQAFRYYIAVSIWAHESGDSRSINPLQSATCEGCKKFNGDIEKLKNEDLLWSDSSITEVHIATQEAPDGEYEVRYQFTLGSHSRPDNQNQERVQLESLDFDSAGILAWDSDGWVTRGLSIEWGSDVH